MVHKLDVLIFVEDPGAANYLFQIPEVLAGRGLKNRLFADGFARGFLEQHGIWFDTFDKGFSAEQVFDQYKPRLIIVGTSLNVDTFGFALLSCARVNKTASIGAVDTFGNAHYRFRGKNDNPLSYAPDWMFVPDDWTRQAFVELGYSNHKIVVCGHPQYDNMFRITTSLKDVDRDRLRKRLLPGIQKDQKAVMFASVLASSSAPLQIFFSPEFTLTGRGGSNTQTEIVLEEFIDAVKLITPRPYLVLRLHPKQTTEDLTELVQDFDFISSGGPVPELIYATDLVVGLPTMLLAEAALMGKPTLAIVARPPEIASLPTIRMGITPCVFTRKQIRTNLAKLLYDNQQLSRTDLPDLFVSGANEPMVEFVEKLLSEQKKYVL